MFTAFLVLRQQLDAIAFYVFWSCQCMTAIEFVIVNVDLGPTILVILKGQKCGAML